ncbi:hypothetical protein [Immundisolibacter sp.]
MPLQTNPNKFMVIELFGHKVMLSERTARDQYILAEYSRHKGMNFSEALLQSMVVLQDGLKINIKQLKWYEIIKWLRFKRLFSRKNIMQQLSAQTITDLAYKVLELEGIDIKKKVMNQPQESAEVLQTG